ncbi:Uncharacterised protein [Escherichia coli]|uniref:hypothetical protein n=1 Tax=Escherichia coli TaxID=562 RepID=UPI0012DC81A6|nr:hypothetical protein [Escherichia coli]EFN7178055.1 hypothetical protein [Escherichia coli]EGZ8549833.1 hypothetical protein [Escherichia coli]EHS3805825.1 hypothetical protein [Escherichia coli]EIM8570449.1 hypothetical protein [Escherichia coli]MDR9379957.1 hypothetical protein [Escherichia coli]
MKNIVVFVVFIASTFLVSGCQKKLKTENSKLLLNYNKQNLNSPISDEVNNITRMERCRRELDALKKVDINVYNKRKSEFDKLISDAVIYNGVRGDVRDYTQGAVDALYRFRSDKLCADISSDMLNNLSE